MSRIRSIKPEFFQHDDLASLDPLTRLLFIGLWTQADRAGRLQDKPRRLKVAVLPYDECDIDAMLKDLAEWGFILRYEVEGERYIQVVHFLDHQQPNAKERESQIPPPTCEHVEAPCKHGASTVLAQDEHPTSITGREGLRPGEGKEGSGDARAPEVAPATRLLPPCFDQSPPFTLLPYAPDATCAQIAWSEAEQAFGAAITLTAAHTAAFASILRAGCLPDCDGSQAQAGECVKFLAETLRRDNVRGSWPQRKGLVRTILTQDRRRAES